MHCGLSFTRVEVRIPVLVLLSWALFYRPCVALHQFPVQLELYFLLKELLRLQELHLESTFTAELPGDPNTKNRRRQVI